MKNYKLQIFLSLIMLWSNVNLESRSNTNDSTLATSKRLIIFLIKMGNESFHNLKNDLVKKFL